MAIDAQVGTIFTVYIVFHWAAAIILNRFKTARHGQLHSKTEHIGNFGIFVSCHLLSNFYTAYIINDVGQIQRSRYFGQFIDSIYDDLFVVSMLFERSQFYFRFVPCYIFSMYVGAKVIICRSTPEVGCQGCTILNDVLAIHFIFGQIAGVLVELHAKTVA